MFRSQSHKNVRCNPKVTLHRNGTCTVSGIPFDMARHIANMAYLRAAEAVEEEAVLGRPLRHDIRRTR
jgi:hypothetical protein